MVDLGAYKDKFGDSGQRILEHALTESRAKPFRHDTRDDVGRPAGREGHDQPDGAIGIVGGTRRLQKGHAEPDVQCSPQVHPAERG